MMDPASAPPMSPIPIMPTTVLSREATAISVIVPPSIHLLKLTKDGCKTPVDQQIDSRNERRPVRGQKFSNVRHFQHGAFAAQRRPAQILILRRPMLVFQGAHGSCDHAGRAGHDSSA